MFHSKSAPTRVPSKQNTRLGEHVWGCRFLTFPFVRFVFVYQSKKTTIILWGFPKKRAPFSPSQSRGLNAPGPTDQRGLVPRVLFEVFRLAGASRALNLRGRRPCRFVGGVVPVSWLPHLPSRTKFSKPKPPIKGMLSARVWTKRS